MERVVIVKKENDEEEVEEAVRIASSLPEGSPFSSSLTSPSQGVRPMEGLHDAGPPPFLTKTYEMVEDPSTDTIVSWSTARNSFIVWDSHRLSTLLLPKYFKHGNFSSFVRQLNTYGFRKIDPDRWEFANEGFLGGQKHLLKTIKRRRNVSQGGQNRGQEGPCVELGHYGLEGEIERLKRDCGVLMAEVIRLRQQQQNSKQQVMSMKDRLQSSEQKQQQLMTFLAKALMNPSFVEGLMKQRQFLQGIQSGRKRRLTACSSEENLQEEVFSAAMGGMPTEDELGMGDPDFETLFTSALDDESSSDIKEELKEGAFRPSSSSGNTANTNDMDDIDWEELLNERLVGSEEAKELSVFEEDVQVGELAEKPNVEWTDDLQYLADRMGF